MEHGKKGKKIEYEKPELVDIMREGAKGQTQYCEDGSGEYWCYDGIAPGDYCSVGTDYF